MVELGFYVMWIRRSTCKHLRISRSVHDTTRHATARHGTTRHDTTRHDTARARHGTTRHGHGTARHGTTRHGTGTARHGKFDFMLVRHSNSNRNTVRYRGLDLVEFGFAFMWIRHSNSNNLWLDAVGRVWPNTYIGNRNVYYFVCN